MTQLVANSSPNLRTRSSPLEVELQHRRKNRLVAFLHKGLPTLPSYLLDLNVLLNSPAVNLKKVAKVIRTDPSLSAQVLRLCNSALFGLRRRVLSIEQAAVLLGTERLRTLVLTCAVMQFAGKHVPAKSLLEFWQHSFLAGLLSERIAHVVEFPESEQAYLGGLLHDIGQLPLWMLVMEERQCQRELPPQNWPDRPAIERDFFGVDHGKVGHWLASSWNLMPSFIDVFEHHHDPEHAGHDPYLVGLVSAVDQFLQTQPVPEVQLGGEADSPATPPAQLEVPLASNVAEPAYLSQCFPSLSAAEHREVFDTLRTEYVHVLPLVQLSLAAVAADVDTESISVQEQST